ncbi:MAG: hypothetical protein ABSH40_18280 [Bryobacteraceae bacterium]|jgi:hypothetical protein
MAKLRFVLLFTAAIASASAGTILDDFNRPNAATLGPNWTQQAGTDQILNDQATAISNVSLATFNGASSTSAFVSVYDNGTGLQYIALDLDFTDTGDNFFIKVQNNGDGSAFDYYGFYYGNNGGGLFAALSQTFTSALMWATFSGTSATLYIDPTFTGVAQQTYTYTFASDPGGTAIGLGFYGAAAADDFGEGTPNSATPEPGTFWLLSSVLAAAGLFGKFRR